MTKSTKEDILLNAQEAVDDNNLLSAAPLDGSEETDSSQTDEGAEDCAIISAKTNYFLTWLFILFIIVIAKIIYLQYSPYGDKLRDNAERTHFKTETVTAKRGDILSANGSVISTSVSMYKVYMDLRSSQLSDEKFTANYEALADSLSMLFGDASPTVYRERLLEWRSKNFGNKLISPPGRLLDYNELRRLEKFPILDGHYFNGGAKSKQQYVRKNYYGSLAGRTIGREETSTARGYGIEKSFDKHLDGENGKQYFRQVSGSFWMPVENRENKEPVNGCDVVTTIDINIQDVAESALRDCLEEHEAISGTAVVMEVSSGKIKAMANLGRNRNGEIIENYNHAIANNVEPGSTFKLVSLITLLENTSTTINTMVDTKKGFDVINGTKVHDSERNGYGNISLKTCMSKSSNIGFARIVDNHYRNNPGNFIAGIHKLGITQPFDFQIEGERTPIVRSNKERGWSKADLVTMSYGYATNFTALRILMLYNAIANKGKLITPYIVSEVRRGDEVIESYQSQVLNNKICSDNTMNQVKVALEDVMFDGTVRDIFKNENYVVAGKTGTSWQINEEGKYESDKGVYYLASFVGYFPADNPKYSCIVQVHTFKPRGKRRAYYGSQLAAPVFRDISHFISMQADWGYTSREYAKQKELELISTMKEGRKVSNSDEVVDYSTYPTRAVGDEINITKLLEAFDIEGYELKYTTTRDNVYTSADIMPNVKGMGLADAIKILEGKGLKVKATGVGSVTKQSIVAGRRFKAGAEVKLTLSMRNVK